MNIRELIIRKLGGIPRPTGATLHLLDSAGFVIVSGYSEDIAKCLGAVLLPKAGEGQHLVKPQVRDNPHRHKKFDSKAIQITTEEIVERFLEMPFQPVNIWSDKPKVLLIPGNDPEIIAQARQLIGINLCDSCKALPKDCGECVDKECDDHKVTQ